MNRSNNERLLRQFYRSSLACRRPVSAIIAVCGILLCYGLASNATFLSWSQEDNGETDVVVEEKALLHEIADSMIASSSSNVRMNTGTGRAQPSSEKSSPHRAGMGDDALAKARNLSLAVSPEAALLFSKESAQQQSQSPPFAIFYNVFIPKDQGEAGVLRSLAIVKEQMDQVGNSYAGSFGAGGANQNQNAPVTVYYNTIGMAEALNETFMTQVCSVQNNIHCVHMNHYNEAFEEVTLQKLSEYCHYHDDDDDNDHDGVKRRVVYMHNKGSYEHHEGLNDVWRRHLTIAVTSELCLKPPEDSCNVCGLTFHGLFLMIFPGNFFVADCNYVRKLIPPADFNDRMASLVALRHQKIAANPQYKYIFPDIRQFDKVVQGRYAPTHWIGSSPLLNPCTLTSDDLRKWFAPRNALADFSWSLLPRKDDAIELDSIRKRQFNVIGGNLFKSFTLYNTAPPDDSWAWRWFPDGPKWKEAVKQYGNRTVDVVVASETSRLEKMKVVPSPPLSSG
jgi:hypothetical protein